MSHSSIFNCLLLANVISRIPFTGTVSEFQSLCEITSHTTCIQVLSFLKTSGIGRSGRAEVTFSARDKLKLVTFALQHGCSPKLLSQNLNWQDFEDFVYIILQKIGYRCSPNVHLRKPHMQIDIVATMGANALVIDCKHWKNMGLGKMEKCATLQYIRAKAYLRSHGSLDYAIPIIITLNEPAKNFVNRIPIVSISKFGSFLSNYDVYTNQLLHVRS